MTPLPYSVSVNEQDGFFYFLTENKSVYRCYFESALTLLPVLGMYDIEAYEFGFYHLPAQDGNPNKFDKRVGITIAQLIADYFSNPRRVLIYICDYSDERGQARQSLFHRWFRQYPIANINRTSIDLQRTRGDVIYILQGGILYRDDFPEMEALQTFLIDKAEDIAIAKYGGE